MTGECRQSENLSVRRAVAKIEARDEGKGSSHGTPQELKQLQVLRRRERIGFRPRRSEERLIIQASGGTALLPRTWSPWSKGKKLPLNGEAGG